MFAVMETDTDGDTIQWTKSYRTQEAAIRACQAESKNNEQYWEAEDVPALSLYFGEGECTITSADYEKPWYVWTITELKMEE